MATIEIRIIEVCGSATVIGEQRILFVFFFFFHTLLKTFHSISQCFLRLCDCVWCMYLCILSVPTYMLMEVRGGPSVVLF